MVKKKSIKKKYIVGTFNQNTIICRQMCAYDCLCKVKNAFNLSQDEINLWKTNNPKLATFCISRTDELINLLCEMKGWEVNSVSKFSDTHYVYTTIAFVEEIPD